MEENQAQNAHRSRAVIRRLRGKQQMEHLKKENVELKGIIESKDRNLAFLREQRTKDQEKIKNLQESLDISNDQFQRLVEAVDGRTNQSANNPENRTQILELTNKLYNLEHEHYIQLKERDEKIMQLEQENGEFQKACKEVKETSTITNEENVEGTSEPPRERIRNSATESCSGEETD